MIDMERHARHEAAAAEMVGNVLMDMCIRIGRLPGAGQGFRSKFTHIPGCCKGDVCIGVDFIDPYERGLGG